MALPKYTPNPDYKVCPVCKELLPNSEFSPNPSRSDKLRWMCKKCNVKSNIEWSHKSGKHKPMTDNKHCPCYLGVYITETLLSKVFANVDRTPTGTTGYDFVCGRGFKVDAKSACTYMQNGIYPCWTYKINRNTVADYFACVAFDNRKSLTPIHFWLIPGAIVNSITTLCILESTIQRWKLYEKSISVLQSKCDQMKKFQFARGVIT